MHTYMHACVCAHICMNVCSNVYVLQNFKHLLSHNVNVYTLNLDIYTFDPPRIATRRTTK